MATSGVSSTTSSAADQAVSADSGDIATTAVADTGQSESTSGDGLIPNPYADDEVDASIESMLNSRYSTRVAQDPEEADSSLEDNGELGDLSSIGTEASNSSAATDAASASATADATTSANDASVTATA